jgi:2'-5' RNA ligase
MTDREQFRLFIAVTIPEEVKARMRAAQVDLHRALPGHGVRWTRPEQFHLTLKFLGGVDAARVPELEEAMRVACRGFGPLHLRAERVGFFPNLRYPRVVWIGVQDQAEQLPRLQLAVDAATREFTAEQKEERFSGHVTLARIKGISRPETEVLAEAAAGMAERRFGQWTAPQVELMRSELLPQGAQHSCLASVALSDAPSELA